MHNSIIGGEDHLIVHLVKSIDRAQNIRIIVAFLMESGAKLLAAPYSGLLKGVCRSGY